MYLTLSHQGKYVIDFKKKTELFNSFIAKQCSIIQNSSKLPLILSKKTEKSISSFTFNCNDIAASIRSLDPSKAHGHDMISIRMLKICGKPVCKPHELIFRSCIKHRKTSNEWEIANVVLVHKKSDKQILKNYRPVSRLIYNSLFEYFIENNLFLQTSLVLDQVIHAQTN